MDQREREVTSKQERKRLMEQQKAHNEVKTLYQKRRRNIYYFMERPETKIAILYHVISLILIIGSIFISILSTIETYENNKVLMDLVLYYELGLLSWFSVEYILRVWSCSFLGKYKGLFGKLKFMRTFYMLIDAFVIISTTTTAILHVKTAYFTILRITRFLQIFRILRVDRQRGDLRTMGFVVNKHRKELVTCYFVGFIILFGGAYIIYICEKASNEEEITINNMANGLYWAMITVTSVGYGDISPKSWSGKIITGVFALVGCAFFALPAGILGSGFALQVAKQKKQRRYIKVRNPAAKLIQTMWRNYTVNKDIHKLQATWHYFFPQTLRNKNSFYEVLPGIKNNPLEAAYKKHFGRKDVQKNSLQKKESLKTDSSKNASQKPASRKNATASFHQNGKIGSAISELIIDPMPRQRKKSSIMSKRHSCEAVFLSQMLNSRFKISIKFILRVKLWITVKRFKTARYPFVNVQDIMEKNAACHTETLSNLREIQDRLIEFRSELQAMKRAFNELIVNNQNIPPTPLTLSPISKTVIKINDEVSEEEVNLEPTNDNAILTDISSTSHLPDETDFLNTADIFVSHSENTVICVDNDEDGQQCNGKHFRPLTPIEKEKIDFYAHQGSIMN